VLGRKQAGDPLDQFNRNRLNNMRAMLESLWSHCLAFLRSGRGGLSRTVACAQMFSEPIGLGTSDRRIAVAPSAGLSASCLESGYEKPEIANWAVDQARRERKRRPGKLTERGITKILVLHPPLGLSIRYDRRVGHITTSF
jgi:hypothetical protein